ncbi:hypothetical protein [Herbaspirillum rubrisubalbicans]|uniref:hypothetical protein n=1 Tax=Herbaspirillum rubrisubalbicans TaxID=80842 RepID=UPI00031287B7|nr:hypothetical protein [Herbaspirillum rubrisubalbicans]
MASSNLLQSHLFSEPLLKIINNPDSSADAVAAAQGRYDNLQKLPGGATIATYLQENHVAIAEPTLLIKEAVMSNPELWQSAPLNNTLQLDQGDFLEGGLSVKTPPYATVNVVLDGKDTLGRDLRISLPAARSDDAGQAVLVSDDDTTQQLLQLDHSQPIIAEVTVSDGYNNRTNYTVWKNNDVRVDLTTPAGMTDFAQSAPALVSDSSYSGRAGDDPNHVPAAQGDSDKITQDGSLRVRLTKALVNDERLQFAVATALDSNGHPLFGLWKEAGKLVQSSTNARGEVDYIASDVVQANGSNWVRARVVLVGSSYTGGYGNANTAADTLQFTLDTVAPPQSSLQFEFNKDDGLSTSDGVSSQRGAQLLPQGALESGAQLHFRLVAGNGTDARTLQLQLPEGLFAVLSALATSAVNGTRAATAELVQGIVDSANKLLGLADGVANPNRRLEFSDGVLTLQQIFMQSEQFDFLNQSGSSVEYEVHVADAYGRPLPEWGHAALFPFGG